MASLTANIVKKGIRTRVKKEQKSPNQMVNHLRNSISLPQFVNLSPPGIKVRKATIAGVNGYWLEVSAPEKVMLYFHGGGFVAGEPRMYFGFCGHLAKRLKANIFLPDYRKAPEYPFPAAPDDCFAVYKALRSQTTSQPFMIGGDSAGGNLTLVTLLRAKNESIQLPDCAMMISPAADVTEVYSRQANNYSDDMFYISMIELIKDLYLNGADPNHPYVSPAKGDLSSLPPLLITVSESEALRDDAYKVFHKAKTEGVAVELISRKKMPHVWPIMYPLLPEARKDMGRIVKFLSQHT